MSVKKLNKILLIIIMDILKNPIIVGILATVVTYGYLYWTEKKKQEENPELKKKNVNLAICGAVGALTWFISGSFISQSGGKTSMLPPNSIIHKYNENVELKSNKSDNSFGSQSFRLVKKGNVQLPNQDVFLDLGSNW